MTLAILKIDERGVIIKANEHANFILECDNCIGENINKILPDSLSLSHSSFIDEYLKTGIKCVLGNKRINRIKTFKSNIIQVEQIIYDVKDISTKSKKYRFVTEFSYHDYRVTPDKLIEKLVPKNLAEDILIAKSPSNRALLTKSLKDYEDVAILFADVAGSTFFSTQNSNKLVAELFYQLYSSFDDLVLCYSNLYKIETAGDSYVIISNIIDNPNVGKEGLIQMYRLALRMGEVAERIFTYNENYNELGLRIGISYGNIAGGITEHLMPRFHIWGSKVNLSARLEQNCESGSILVCDDSYNIIKSVYTNIYANKQTLYFKGFGATTCWMIPLLNNVGWAKHRENIISDLTVKINTPTKLSCENMFSDEHIKKLSKKRSSSTSVLIQPLADRPRSPSFREYITYEKENQGFP
jgi:class 3 adenylate cyclase